VGDTAEGVRWVTGHRSADQEKMAQQVIQMIDKIVAKGNPNSKVS
jgi:hypothetical protein